MEPENMTKKASNDIAEDSMGKMWKIVDDQLRPVASMQLATENKLEDWIEEDPSMLGLDILLIGRQVNTQSGGIIDLLGIDRRGDLVIIKLKRNRTPRDIVAQVLDYASWTCTLSTRQVHEIAENYLATRNGETQSLYSAFTARFGMTLPDNLNGSHSIIIVAGELDDQSKRIVKYLATEHGLEINTVFFNCFRDSNGEYVVAVD